VNSLGERVRAIRVARGETTREMAARVGISAPYLSLIENGKRSVSLATLCKLAEYCGVPADALLQTPVPRDVEAEALCDAIISEVDRLKRDGGTEQLRQILAVVRVLANKAA